MDVLNLLRKKTEKKTNEEEPQQQQQQQQQQVPQSKARKQTPVAAARVMSTTPSVPTITTTAPATVDKSQSSEASSVRESIHVDDSDMASATSVSGSTSTAQPIAEQTISFAAGEPNSAALNSRTVLLTFDPTAKASAIKPRTRQISPVPRKADEFVASQVSAYDHKLAWSCSGSVGSHVRVMDDASNLACNCHGFKRYIIDLALSPCQNLLAAVDKQGALKIFRLYGSLQKERVFSYSFEEGEVNVRLQWNHDSKQLAVCRLDQVHIFSTEALLNAHMELSSIKEETVQVAGGAACAAFSLPTTQGLAPSGSTLVVGTQSGRMDIFERDSDHEPFAFSQHLQSADVEGPVSNLHFATLEPRVPSDVPMNACSHPLLLVFYNDNRDIVMRDTRSLEVLQTVHVQDATPWHVAMQGPLVLLASSSAELLVCLMLACPPATVVGQPRNYGRARFTGAALCQTPTPCLDLSIFGLKNPKSLPPNAADLTTQFVFASATGIVLATVDVPAIAGDWSTGSFFVDSSVGTDTAAAAEALTLTQPASANTLATGATPTTAGSSRTVSALLRAHGRFMGQVSADKPGKRSKIPAPTADSPKSTKAPAKGASKQAAAAAKEDAGAALLGALRGKGKGKADAPSNGAGFNGNGPADAGDAYIVDELSPEKPKTSKTLKEAKQQREDSRAKRKKPATPKGEEKGKTSRRSGGSKKEDRAKVDKRKAASPSPPKASAAATAAHAAAPVPTSHSSPPAVSASVREQQQQQQQQQQQHPTLGARLMPASLAISSGTRTMSTEVAASDVQSEVAPELQGHGIDSGMLYEFMEQQQAMLNRVASVTERQATQVDDALQRLERLEQNIGQTVEMAVEPLLEENEKRMLDKLTPLVRAQEGQMQRLVKEMNTSFKAGMRQLGSKAAGSVKDQLQAAVDKSLASPQFAGAVAKGINLDALQRKITAPLQETLKKVAPTLDQVSRDMLAKAADRVEAGLKDYREQLRGAIDSHFRKDSDFGVLLASMGKNVETMQAATSEIASQAAQAAAATAAGAAGESNGSGSSSGSAEVARAVQGLQQQMVQMQQQMAQLHQQVGQVQQHVARPGRQHRGQGGPSTAAPTVSLEDKAERLWQLERYDDACKLMLTQGKSMWVVRKCKDDDWVPELAPTTLVSLISMLTSFLVRLDSKDPRVATLVDTMFTAGITLSPQVIEELGSSVQGLRDQLQKLQGKHPLRKLKSLLRHLGAASTPTSRSASHTFDESFSSYSSH